MQPSKPLKSLTDKELYAKCKEYGQNARLWRRKFAGLLPEVVRRSLYRRRNCGSIYEFAAKLGGMSKESVDKVLRISQKFEDKPLLTELLVSGTEAWSKLEKVAYIATLETESFWAEKIQELPQPALEAFVQNYRSEVTLQSNFEPENHTFTEHVDWAERGARGSKTGAPTKERVEFETTPTLARKFNQAKKRADFNNLLEEFLQFVGKREASTKPAAAVTSSRHMPAEIERFVRQRTNGLCAFPGCQKLGTSIHHTQRWTLENVHDPDRMHLLCTAHERIAHASLIENEEMAPEHWKIRINLNSQGLSEPTNPLAVLSPKSYIDSLVAIKRQGG